MTKKTTKTTAKKGMISDTRKALRGFFGARDKKKIQALSRAWRVNHSQEVADQIVPFVLKRVNAARKSVGLPELDSLCSGVRWSESGDALMASLAPIFRYGTSEKLALSNLISARDEAKVAKVFDRKRTTHDALPTPTEFRVFIDAYDLGYFPHLELS